MKRCNACGIEMLSEHESGMHPACEIKSLRTALAEERAMHSAELEKAYTRTIKFIEADGETERTIEYEEGEAAVGIKGGYYAPEDHPALAEAQARVEELENVVRESKNALRSLMSMDCTDHDWHPVSAGDAEKMDYANRVFGLQCAALPPTQAETEET